jgi:hypothetical protein
MKEMSMMKRLMLLVIPLLLTAQSDDGADVWEPIRYFVGTWEGTSTGKAGEGQGERTYEFIMNSTYLHCRNSMEFEPREQNPEGEVHEDWAFFSYDQGREMLVMRQFNVEGFINQFTLDSLSSDNTTLFLNTEHSENSPPGLLARYTFEIRGEDEFVEIFEIGFAGQEYSCWMTNTWHRESSRR